MQMPDIPAATLYSQKLPFPAQFPRFIAEG
jgi:hypothetical protein